MYTAFKANASLCRHGMRDDCPVEQCRIQVQHANPSIIYSSALKGPVPTPAMPVPANSTPTNVSFSQQRQFGAPNNRQSEMCIPQHTSPNPLHPPPLDEASAVMRARASSGGAMDEMELGQAVDGLTLYQGLLNSQVMAQRAKIYAMSSQFHIPVPDLDSSSFRMPRLPFMAPPVVTQVSETMNASATMPTDNGTFIPDENVPHTAPPAPLLQPAQAVPGLYQTQGAPLSVHTTASGPPCAAAPGPVRRPLLDQHPNAISRAGIVSKQATSTAPKKDDMAYKTTPCRHFALNDGWCPWGDECGFIHDPELEWAPAAERNSGRSTPSSTTIVGNKSAPADKTAGSNSGKSAHCWGYIQGICPHLEKCRYLHPEDIMPFIKYTPCLTWPRCGYPTHHCPLKHPQVDKFNPQQRNQRPPTTTTVVPQPRENIAPRTETYSDTRVPQPQLTPAMPFPIPAAEGLFIPHDEAYASAKLHHRATAPSPEMFTPAPTRPVVRMRRPSEGLGRPQDQGQAAAPGMYGLGMGSYQGRARSMTIAVQKLDAELAEMAQRVHVKVGGKGHGRGKSMNL